MNIEYSDNQSIMEELLNVGIDIVDAILKGIVEFAAQDALIAATDVAIKGLDKMSEAVEKKSDKKLQKYLEANPDHCHLFVSQIRYKFKETYRWDQ